MTIFLLILTILIGLALWYALAGRRWLLTKSWAQPFFKWVEPIETALFKKSETILVGRVMWAGGILVTAYDSIAVFASSLDLTPITSRVLSSVPEDMRGLVVSLLITGIGFLVNWLRKRVTKPIEIVALPIDSPPAVTAAAENVEAANQQAVATITAAQDAGKV